MEKKLRVTENLLLKILADQSGLSRKEIAKALNITPQWLSTILNSDEKLSEEIKAKASSFFKVSSDYFNKTKIDEVLPIVEEPPSEYQVGASWQYMAEMESRLREEIARLQAETKHLTSEMRNKDDMIDRLLKIIEQGKKE